MKIKIKVQTPNNTADKILPELKRLLLGVSQRQLSSFEVYTNPEGSLILMDIEGHLKKILKIQRNLALYDTVMQNMMTNKKIHKLAGFKNTPEKQKEIDDLLLNHTHIEIVKEATAQELEENGRSWWQNLKARFTRKE
jgi:hypothetical protein